MAPRIQMVPLYSPKVRCDQSKMSGLQEGHSQHQEILLVNEVGTDRA